MNVPFHLRRCSQTDPAAAALFLGPESPRRLLDLCATLDLDPAGRVFGVSDGLLLVLQTPSTAPLPGALRLRVLAPNLLLPVDADLVPSLLDDEARGLGRDRGLIFLPGDRALAFDPHQPLPLSALLTATPLPRRDWQPLPDRPAPADRIGAILIDFPEESPESALDAGSGGEVGADAEDPSATDAGKSGVSRAWNQVKSFLSGESGQDRAKAEPPLPDFRTVRRQEDALRELVRQFRDGNTERALRRALPVGDPAASRGPTVSGGSKLPDRPLLYRLRDLLGGSGKDGPVGVWLGGDDLMAALVREYRKAAEEATRRGDYRRAAAIYGKLLHDDRAAVNALLQGGLYHDAAVLLLARLNDHRGAARAFASAGEIDRAVELHREVGENEAAGDLLRSVGEEDAAVAEYQLAANRLATTSAGHLAAGNLLLEKAGRPDLAMRHYASGWICRPAANEIPCALKYARLLAEVGDVRAVHSLMDEADSYFAGQPDVVKPAQFYRGIASLADLAGLAPARDDLRDRALMGLATQMRGRVWSGEKAQSLVPLMLGADSLWPPAVISDASHAVAVATRSRPAGAPRLVDTSSRVRLCTGTISAVAGAIETGEVFVGTAGGDVWAYRPETSEILSVASHDLPVAALATDPWGDHLVVLRWHESGRGVISSYARQDDDRYSFLNFTQLEAVSLPWLTPVLQGATHNLVGLWDGDAFYVLSVATLSSLASFPLPDLDSSPPAGMLIGREGNDEFSILTHLGREWHRLYPCEGSIVPTGVHWRPGIRSGDLRSVPLSVFEVPGGLPEVAGLSDQGILHWARMPHAELTLLKATGAIEPEFLAAAIVREGLVAAVSRSQVDWLRCGATHFLPWRTTSQSIPSAVAAFASGATNEVIVVCRDGELVRIPVPD